MWLEREKHGRSVNLQIQWAIEKARVRDEDRPIVHELNPCIYSCYCSYSWCVIFSFIRICRICFDVPVEKIIFSYTFVVDLKVKADKFIFDFFLSKLDGFFDFLGGVLLFSFTEWQSSNFWQEIVNFIIGKWMIFRVK